MVERFASDEHESLAILASFYAGVNRTEEALRTWNRVPDEGKNANRAVAEAIARRLFEQGSFAVASEFARQSGLDKTARPGAITNGDFETGIKEQNSFLFDWAISRTDGRSDIGSDSSIAHSGKRSLRALFRAYTKLPFSDIQQTIAVRPGSRQRIEFWLRTENLRSGSMPTFLFVNGQGQQILGVTPPFPVGTNDWQKMSVDIDVPADSEGIRVVSSREPCPAECPLTGIFWLDDFRITELVS